MTDISNCILIGLAAAYMIRAWLNGSIFAEVRSWIEDGGIQSAVKPAWLADKLAALLQCYLCLSFWVSITIALVLAIAYPSSSVAMFLVESFAAATIAVVSYGIMAKLG